ncbi:MAG TPA: hypothetical protein VHD60_03080 [Candidatus Saccharimonadales bacterium]|nr:hypothetical protein [Candidatus Saccharimonadales bacterium]
MARAVFFKQSGERLAATGGDDNDRDIYHPSGVRTVGEKLAQVHKLQKELDLSGITVVSGAGNIIRGDRLREKRIAMQAADVLGRLATIQNTIVIAEQLELRGVPHQIFITNRMKVQDQSLRAARYDAADVCQTHAEGKIALIGGGTGEDNVTTDNAVVWYAQDYRNIHDGNVTILKGTQVDGVFEDDPSKRSDARRYKIIGAPYMLANYERYGVVDKASLQQLIDSNLSMVVYADGGHDLETVLRHDPERGNGTSIGTVIMPTDVKPVYYEAA